MRRTRSTSPRRCCAPMIDRSRNRSRDEVSLCRSRSKQTGAIELPQRTVDSLSGDHGWDKQGCGLLSAVEHILRGEQRRRAVQRVARGQAERS